MNKGHVRLFIVAASVILFSTGVAKIVSAAGNASILGFKDPVFHVSYRSLFCFSGILELFIALGCYLMNDQIARVSTVGWFAVCVATYRLAFHCLGPARWCPCLGTLTDSLHISATMADLLLDGTLAYMIGGSIVILVCHYHAKFTTKTQLHEG